MPFSHRTTFFILSAAAYLAAILTSPTALYAKSSKSSTADLFEQDTTPLDRERQDKIVSFAEVLEDVTPAVVGIYPSRIVKVTRGGINPLEELLRRYYGIPSPYQEKEESERRMPQGVGSGVIVSSDGYILTNHHVIYDGKGQSADEIEVVLTDNRRFLAEIIGSDSRTDVAVLKIDAEALPYLQMTDSNNLAVGDIVFAVGNPFRVGITVTMGIVSATGRTGLGILGRQGYEDFIQTDASINPGNSGGALVDAEGRLVGVNTAIISRTGGNLGIGFAIPINLARQITLSLIETGSVQRGFLGVRIDDLTYDLAEAFGIEAAKGALIQQVEPGLPADKAGIQRGDVVTEVDGQPIESAIDLRLTIAAIPPGTTIDVSLIRQGKAKEVEVTLGNLDDPLSDPEVAGTSALKGVSLKKLTEEDRSRYNIDAEVDGLMVTQVKGESPYFGDLIEGMIIIEINDQPLKKLQDVSKYLRKGVNKLWVYYNNGYGYLALRVQ